MEPKPPRPSTEEKPQAPASDVPPKEDPEKVAGSINPKQKAAFYEAVIGKAGKRKRL